MTYNSDQEKAEIIGIKQRLCKAIVYWAGKAQNTSMRYRVEWEHEGENTFNVFPCAVEQLHAGIFGTPENCFTVKLHFGKIIGFEIFVRPRRGYKGNDFVTDTDALWTPEKLHAELLAKNVLDADTITQQYAELLRVLEPFVVEMECMHEVYDYDN
jgi:hypothetical protein